MTEKEKLFYWKSLTRQSLITEKYVTKEILKYFKVTFEKLINLVENYGTEEAINRLEIEEDKKALLLLYGVIYLHIAKVSFPLFEARIKKELNTDIANGFEYSLFVKKVQELVNSVGPLQRVDSIINTTKEKIEKILTEAKTLNLTPSKLRTFIKKNLLGQYSLNRSKLIAHVETSYIEAISQEDSAIYVARQLGILLEKSWIHVMDEKTRSAHRAVDTKYIPIEDKFNVGGYQAKMPFDPSLPLGLTIGCRCRCHYRKKEGGFI